MAASNEYKLISADSHVLEPPDDLRGAASRRACATARRSSSRTTAGARGSSTDRAGAVAGDRGDRVRVGTGPPTVRVADGPVSWDAVLPALYDPAERVQAQWSDSVDAEILYPSTGLWDAIKQLDDAELKLALVRGVQRLDRRVLRVRSRTGCSGWRSCRRRACEDAQAELLRCVNELGLRGAVLDTWPSGAPTGGNPADEPFWETVNDLARADQPALRRRTRGRSRRRVSGIAPGLRPPMADALLPMVAARRVRPLSRREGRVRARRRGLGAALDGVLRHQLRAAQAPLGVHARRIPTPCPRSTCAGTRGSRSIRIVRR